MLSKVVVVPEAEFKRWYFGGENEPPPNPLALAPGAPKPTAMAILNSHDCLTCHSIDGSVMVGPTFRGLFGQKVEVVAGGQARTALVDEAHLRLSLGQPGALRMKGYPDVMPPARLNPVELDEIITYLKGLRCRGPYPPAAISAS
jgi:cytochrome c oxidase subunit 2